MKTVIISGGSLDDAFALDYLLREQPDCIIAADRGMKFCYEHGFCPDYVMGDFDSVDKDIEAYYRDQAQVCMITFPPEKDDTDTEIALKKAIELGSTKIVILGALGGRMDHCLANIHLLKLALDQNVSACLLDRQNHISLISDSCRVEKATQYGTYISFLPFTDRVTGVSLEGFKYPLEHYTMEKGYSLGVSNEIEKDYAQVTIENGLLIMVQSRD